MDNGSRRSQALPTVIVPIKGETLIMYLAILEESISAVLMVERGKRQKLFTDGASSSDGSGAGLILVSPEGKEYTYDLMFEFKTTNNEAEYDALLVGLRIAKEMKVQELTIFVDSQLVANQVKGLFEARQPVIKQYLEKAKELLASFPSYSIEHIKRDQNKKADALSKLASMIFSKLAKEVLVEMGKLQDDPQKARKLRIKALLYKIIDGTLYQRSYLSPWLRRAGVEVTNREIVKGMEHRLGMTHQGWVDVLPQVLWAHRTTPKSSNEETPFCLVHGSKAVIPIEISIETRRIQDFDPKQNKKRCREDLDILEERREITLNKEAHYKQKLEGYYNKRVRPSTIKPGTYVLKLNSASKAEFQGKMGPTWEGPYIVKKAYGDGAYKLETSPIDRHGMGQTCISSTYRNYYLQIFCLILLNPH
ncbi:reverse transcriptase domain-containing protein [Tanacetum coccineum]